MSKGIAQAKYVGKEAYVNMDDVPNWSFIYSVSTVRDPRFNIGDRVVLPDGRVFRYAKSGSALYTGRGNRFYNAIPATGIDYSLLAKAAAVGDTKVVMTNQGVVAQTLDGLRGGLIVLKPAAGSGDNELQFRGIIGNTAGGVSDEITIFLDGPLTEALTGASYAFCMPSPYSDIRYDTGDPITSSFAGIAAVEVSAANMYFWLQTWGLCWLAPQSGVGATGDRRAAYWRHDGSIDIATNIGTHVCDQYAGFIVDNNAAANGSTLFMLQVAP